MTSERSVRQPVHRESLRIEEYAPNGALRHAVRSPSQQSVWFPRLSSVGWQSTGTSPRDLGAFPKVLASNKHILVFGCFRLEISERLLLADGQAVPLTPKVFDLLVLLVTHPGELLEKEFIISTLLPKTFVEEANLSVNISTLRRALESAGGAHYIETIPKRGYRFTAESGRFQVYKQRLDVRRGEMLTWTPQVAVLPLVAPGGQWVLFAERTGASNAPHASSLYSLRRVPIHGGTPQEVPAGGSFDEFRCPVSQRGTCVLRETIGHQQFVYYALDPVAGKGRQLGRTAWTPTFLADWDVSPDGSTIAIAIHDRTKPRIRLVFLGLRTQEGASAKYLSTRNPPSCRVFRGQSMAKVSTPELRAT